MAVVCIVTVYAVSGDFKRHTVNYDSHRSVLYTGLYYPLAAKYLFCFFGTCACGYIPVKGIFIQHTVANGAADGICLKTAAFQQAYCLIYLFGELYHNNSSEYIFNFGKIGYSHIRAHIIISRAVVVIPAGGDTEVLSSGYIGGQRIAYEYKA